MKLTISDICSILTTLFAAFSFFYSLKVQRSLGALQKELTALELKNAKDIELSKGKAEFTARFVTYGNYSKKLVITNTGQAKARDVKINFSTPPNFVMTSSLGDYFPCELDSSDSVKLLSHASLGQAAIREKFTLSWMDDSGGSEKEFNIQYD
ncbi:hypothetical protein [Photobacterium leiognathi]|uniref:hypothetical protein n=1 Tax=Photobacterium leiognathi TaxID=553611 RepID=UPI00273A0625|nr:hypothetical protein [Photobacterium leiognathi]